MLFSHFAYRKGPLKTQLHWRTFNASSDLGVPPIAEVVTKCHDVMALRVRVTMALEIDATSNGKLQFLASLVRAAARKERRE